MFPCECIDPECPEHTGKSSCDNRGVMILYRVDMTDRGGTGFCVGCGDDAMESGLFAAKEAH